MSEVDVEKEQSRQDAGGTEEAKGKFVSMAEAMQYRKRALAAERELAALKEKIEGGLKETPSPAHQNADCMASGKYAVDDRILVRGTPPCQGESFLAGEHVGSPLRETVKTQGARELRGGSLRALMERAAVRAAESGRRADLQEYLRVRRAFV